MGLVKIDTIRSFVLQLMPVVIGKRRRRPKQASMWAATQPSHAAPSSKTTSGRVKVSIVGNIEVGSHVVSLDFLTDGLPVVRS